MDFVARVLVQIPGPQTPFGPLLRLLERGPRQTQEGRRDGRALLPRPDCPREPAVTGYLMSQTTLPSRTLGRPHHAYCRLAIGPVGSGSPELRSGPCPARPPRRAMLSERVLL